MSSESSTRQQRDGLEAWLRHCSQAMLEDATSEVAKMRAEKFRAALDSATLHEWESGDAPLVLDDLGHLSSPILGDIDMLRSLPWVENQRFGERSDECALVLLEQCVRFERVSAGILLMAAQSFYPEHHHPPSEMYLVVAGEAHWRFGGADEYVPVAQTHTLMNEPNDLHGLRTDAEPVLALWVLFEDEVAA